MQSDLEFWVIQCDNCHKNFRKSGDNWYRVERMHDDRIGLGPMYFHSRLCTIAWLSAQLDF